MAQLYFKFGAMGSSKTANALMARFNYEERGQETLMVKPRLDSRDGDHMVSSRIGLKHPCVYFHEMRQMDEEELKKNACIIVKGVRNITDFDSEMQMARINQGIEPELETLLLPARAEFEHFSSTMVREMIRYHQPLEKYVPAPVAEELMRQRG